MTPPVNPSREIEDPDDRKPEDWDERPKIPDPDAVKPDDWLVCDKKMCLCVSEGTSFSFCYGAC